MSSERVYCEPFCIQKGYSFEIHHVSYGVSDQYSCFMHFHEVHELIIFQSVDGTYFYNQGQSKLQNSDIVFTPSLETHDFELQPGAKSWHIIQFLPEFLDSEDLTDARMFFQRGMHLRLSPQDMQSLSQQIQWLFESYQKDPHSELSISILKLLLLWLAEKSQSVKPIGMEPVRNTQNLQRLKPVIERFRKAASVNLSLEQAAELCHLSPSYFSRLFKSVFRCNYSEYVNQHKLYNAARMLSQTTKSITQVSYELEFSSPSHFIALFKRQFGMTPKKYQSQVSEHVTDKQTRPAKLELFR